MDFSSANPSIVRSIKQRVLLNSWLRALGPGKPPCGPTATLTMRSEPNRYARVAPCYLACVARRRPTYSISQVCDTDGKDVSYERLLMPFGRGERVEQIVGSYKAISFEGRFKASNLMGSDAATAPVRLLNAVIDRELARRPAGVRIADDIVEAY